VVIRDHAFLELALGLRSTIARLDRLLERYAPEPEASDAPEPGELDRSTAAVLGVIAIRNRLLAELDALPADPGREVRASTAKLSSGGWLR
jgi:hypothetical protein